MAILEKEKYEWYEYKNKKSYPLTSSREQTHVICKGEMFGLRASSKSKDVKRLIVEVMGPKVIFSVSAKEVLALKKASIELKSVPQLDPKVTKIIAKLKDVPAKDFWKIVETLEWNKNHKASNYSSLCQQALVESYSKKENEKLGAKVGRLAKTIRTSVVKFEKMHKRQLFELGDDSFFDACCEAVSLGEKRYLELLKSPEMFCNIFNRPKSFKESFLYCFN